MTCATLRAWLAGAFFCCISQSLFGQTGTLAEPFPPPSPNAALHYQRALLMLNALDARDQALLKKPIWEVFPDGAPVNDREDKSRQANATDEFPGEIHRLLYRARHATKAASSGSRLEVCDFGIDFSVSGASTVLPHIDPMVQLGRLLTLRGAYAESQGKWDEAAVIYFDGLRMGRHLTRGRTLLEAIAGMQILENNYFALAKWSTRCPKGDLIARAFGLLETMQDQLINPSRTLASEASILAIELQQLRDAFPRGDWGTMILDSLELESGADEEANRKAAVAACAKKGVPKEAFGSTRAFREYLDRLDMVSTRFAEAASACMRLRGEARVKRGTRLSEQYAKRFGALGQKDLLDVAELGAMFSSHESNLVLLRVALALGTKKAYGELPEDLSGIASGFGGQVPTSPYDGSDIQYELSKDGKSYGLRIAENSVAGVLLPAVDFSSAAPETVPTAVAK